MFDVKILNIVNAIFGAATVATILDYLPVIVGILAGLSLVVLNIVNTSLRIENKKLVKTQRELAEKQKFLVEKQLGEHE